MKRAAKAAAFDLKVEFDRETDGRWIDGIPAVSAIPESRRSQKSRP